MGRLLSGSRPYHDLPNVPSLTSGGLGWSLGLIRPRGGGYRTAQLRAVGYVQDGSQRSHRFWEPSSPLEEVCKETIGRFLELLKKEEDEAEAVGKPSWRHVIGVDVDPKSLDIASINAAELEVN
ncbi:hypothetical protein QJS10_CPA07g00802 [Acorus calamus]|uniref:Uncharacterized protein n=1 Tax=Acorus calamus TaxID=4465 RepID=A0AAV9EF32_ACOCL|nr:hypothetical protein QJS10_CPA07g00802 [Acorus calamus]